MTLSGRNRSFCCRSTHRRRLISLSKNLRYPEGVRSGWISPWLSRNRIFEIVTSGKSSRRRVRTSPMARCPGVSVDDTGAPDHHYETEFPHLNLIAFREFGLIDPLTVHIRSVERPDIGQQE